MFLSLLNDLALFKLSFSNSFVTYQNMEDIALLKVTRENRIERPSSKKGKKISKYSNKKDK